MCYISLLRGQLLEEHAALLKDLFKEGEDAPEASDGKLEDEWLSS